MILITVALLILLSRKKKEEFPGSLKCESLSDGIACK